MQSKALGWLRLLLAIPAALLVTLVVQYGATALFWRVLTRPCLRPSSMFGADPCRPV